MGPARATPSFLGALFVLLSCVQLIVYRDSFTTKPSNDDFISLHQVDRGEREGVWSFFTRSDVGDYRPLQNATFWVFGRWSRPHRLISLRILHLLSFVFYAAVALLWVRSLGFSRGGALVAAVVVFLHPTLAGSLAGLDNYSRLVASAWVWLGAWIAGRFAGRLSLAVPLVSLCFILGLGYMEYAIALIPLAVLTTAWPGGMRRAYHAGVMFVTLGGIFAAYFLLRVSGMVATGAGTSFLALDPRVWAKNVVMILGAVLYSGNTVPVMVERTPPRLACLGLNVSLAALALAYGLWSGRRNSLTRAGQDSRSSPASFSAPPLHTGFLLTAFAVTFFPMLLMGHISEIYLTAVTLGLGLLTGLSAHGWSAATRPLRVAAMFFAGFQVVLAADAIQEKVAGINDAGDRAEAMMLRLLEHLPDDGAARRVAIVFLNENGAAGRGYSVFAMPDDQLFLQGAGAFALDWYRPGQKVRLDHFIVGRVSDVRLERYDLALLWEGSTRRFIPAAPLTGRPGPRAPSESGPSSRAG
ncbi:MAG: hypothetical protein DMF52_09945 [Acidobacteria bacterium]|nr:MAG: hypothetical protein DMF52_09945 [Acidobacteriota bacterium]